MCTCAHTYTYTRVVNIHKSAPSIRSAHYNAVTEQYFHVRNNTYTYVAFALRTTMRDADPHTPAYTMHLCRARARALTPAPPSLPLSLYLQP